MQCRRRAKVRIREQSGREIFFDPRVMTVISLVSIVGGVVVTAFVDMFGSSHYMPIPVVGAGAVICLFEIWWLNFRYCPSE